MIEREKHFLMTIKKHGTGTLDVGSPEVDYNKQEKI